MRLSETICWVLIFIGLMLVCFGILKILDHQAALEKQISEIQLVPEQITVEATAFSREDFPGLTALCRIPIANYSIAVSRDLIYLLGKTLYVEGVGVVRVDDLMNERWTKRVDIFVETSKEANAFGIKKNLRIAILP